MVAFSANRVQPRWRATRNALNIVVIWWSTRRERSRQRRALGRLDERLLRDIGVTRCDAAREAGKPFWR
jgi:uncharacterized protein YjiS (DUF1127 family)